LKKKLITALIGAMLCVPAIARDTLYKLPFSDVLTQPAAAGKLDGSVKFYLKGQTTPIIIEKFSEDVANRKTNGVGKEDVMGCQWVALSNLIAFQEKAKQVGANAVIDIVSYYKKNEFTSTTEFECHAGAFVIGVAFKGTYAKVAP